MADDIANADVFQRGERARDGEYTFVHLKTSYEKTRKGPALIIEHEVVEAKKILPDVEPNAVGSRVSYFMPDYGDAAVMLQPNMKNYVCGLAGHDSKTVDKALLKELIKKVGGPEQIGRGMYIKASTFHTEKRSDGEDFMGFNWYSVPGENTPNAPGVLKRRAEIDAKLASGSASQGANGSSNAATGGAPPSLPANGAPALPGADPLATLLSQGWKVHPGDATFLWRGPEFPEPRLMKKDELIAQMRK
jgi:hypothetical protein